MKEIGKLQFLSNYIIFNVMYGFKMNYRYKVLGSNDNYYSIVKI